MIDVFFWPTGNGKKITIMLEECELPYRLIPINIAKGDQHSAEFLSISPNNKMPAIVDHDVDGPAISLFESGAILQYLAEKTGCLLPREPRARMRVMQWLFWQVGGIGPMCGQAHFFLHYSSEKIPFAMERFQKEVARLYSVLDRQLETNEYIAGDYSIADIATWPWIFRYDWQGQDLQDFPNIKRWFETLQSRPAVQRGAAAGADLADLSRQMSEEDKARLFNLGR